MRTTKAYNALMNRIETTAGILCFCAMIIISTKLMVTGYEQYATAFFSKGLTVNDLVLKYNNPGQKGKIRILIVPGHEPNYGGAEYGALLERDLNLQLADKLTAQLVMNQKFKVIQARDVKGWNPIIRNYVVDNLTEIKNWRDSQQTEMDNLVASGRLSLNQTISHNSVSAGTALMLYGINKWANDNDIDITLQIHFNDNPKLQGKPKYEGFAIYVPESQYSNSSSSVALAQDLLAGLKKKFKVSTFSKESAGIVEDQELIAVGSFNTADSLVALIEYEYIYEPILGDKTTRDSFIAEAASSTAIALETFFESRDKFGR
jgi:N-acetylmuramoyl-L-alanine amidase